jgi:UDP-N-acetylglucosamine 2-epimerase (non-hydrolysing)
MKKILLVFGTRPEAIKMAPVILELKKYPELLEYRVCVTAQHRQMLDQILDLFGISPDYDLDIMESDQALDKITAQSLTGLTPVIKHEQPDWLLIQGDTTTVMSAALAAFYLEVKVAHLEAGLRTGDKLQPFPEEINRRIVSAIADHHFAPTEWAKTNLHSEGIPESKISVTGNTVIDAMHLVLDKPPDFTDSSLKEIPWGKHLILVTAHRRENFGHPLENICAALKILADRYAGQVHFIYPVHLNPNVTKTATEMLGDNLNITIVPPLDYHRLVHLMNQCYLILTDSGGIQEEAPSLGKPVLVMRNKTERPEGIAAGVARIVGTDTDRLVAETSKLIEDKSEYLRMSKPVHPYGDGRASKRIVEFLINSGERME